MRTITIKIQKTIQEDPYEPFMLALETTVDIPKQLTKKEINELIDSEYYDLCDKQNELLEKRLNE